MSLLFWNFKINRRFLTQREGAVLPIFALMVIFLIVVMGAAVDVSRTVNAREKLAIMPVFSVKRRLASTRE